MGIMKILSVKDQRKRAFIHKSEEKQKCLKSLKHNHKLGLNWWSRHKLSTLPPRIYNNRCIMTSRGKSVNKSFKLSRLEFRRWVNIKLLPGLVKSSW